MEYRESLINDYLFELQKALDQLPVDQILKAVDVIQKARLEKRTIFTMGNGGSSATASHMGCDFSKNTRSPELPARIGSGNAGGSGGGQPRFSWPFFFFSSRHSGLGPSSGKRATPIENEVRSCGPSTSKAGSSWSRSV